MDAKWLAVEVGSEVKSGDASEKWTLAFAHACACACACACAHARAPPEAGIPSVLHLRLRLRLTLVVPTPSEQCAWAYILTRPLAHASEDGTVLPGMQGQRRTSW